VLKSIVNKTLLIICERTMECKTMFENDKRLVAGR